MFEGLESMVRFYKNHADGLPTIFTTPVDRVPVRCAGASPLDPHAR
jgi:hypothetical protein